MPRFLCFSIVLVFLLMAGGAQLTNAERFPGSFARTLYMLNGDFSAKLETVDDQGNTVTSYANITEIPIIVKGKKNPTILYMETYPAGRNLLFDLHQDSNGFVHYVIYTVSNDDAQESLKHSPAKLPDNAKIIPADGCNAITEEIEPGLIDGHWIDCTREVNGQYPVYVFQATCEYIQLVVDTGTETITLKYDFQGKRYPWVPEVLAKMKGTENVCQCG